MSNPIALFCGGVSPYFLEESSCQQPSLCNTWFVSTKHITIDYTTHIFSLFFARYNVYTFPICNCTLLAIRPNTTALDLVKPTLSVGIIISRWSDGHPQTWWAIDKTKPWWLHGTREIPHTAVHARETRPLSFVASCPWPDLSKRGITTLRCPIGNIAELEV